MPEVVRILQAVPENAVHAGVCEQDDADQHHPTCARLITHSPHEQGEAAVVADVLEQCAELPVC